MTEQQKERLFEIETYAKALAYLAANDNADLGNHQILTALLALKIEECTHEILQE